MHEISIVWLDANVPMIKPLREKLKGHLCSCYSMSNPLKNKDDTRIGVISSAIPFYVRKCVDFLSRYHIVPGYYGFKFQHFALDYVFASKVAQDNSTIVFVHESYKRCIKESQKKGKIVVTMAGNAEPSREYQRVMAEYASFAITKKYIYGDVKYQSRIRKNLVQANRIISISKVSEKTFIEAGYDKNKFRLIPLTGTDYIPQSTYVADRPKAFITIAFHSFIKGTHRLLLAWKEAGIEGIPLIVAGRLCDDMKEFVEKNGPFNNVIFTGYIQGSLNDFYKQYDAVGVLMSLSEGAVRTTPELMSYGFPMIVSPDATCDIVKNKINGFIVDPKNEVEIVEKLKWFAEDWDRVHQMRPRVLTSVSHRTVREFSEDCADYLMSLIKESE